MLSVEPRTLAALAWAWRDRDPNDATPPALQWLEDHWKRRDALPPNVVT